MKIRDRTRLHLGRVSLDDHELKVGRLLKYSIYRTDVTALPRSQFRRGYGCRIDGRTRRDNRTVGKGLKHAKPKQSD